MPVWKILIIGMLFCISLGLAMATIVIPLSMQGSERWMWLGGLLVTTAGTGGVFALFLRYADRHMDGRTRGARY